MNNTVTCPECEHEQPITKEDMRDGTAECDECGTRIEDESW